jgi:hypothetical protein
LQPPVIVQQNSRRSAWNPAWFAALLAGCCCVAVLFIFDPTQESFFPVCYFYRTTGLLCPGCGSLRALHALSHGHVLAAFHFNALLILLLPIMAWLIVHNAWQKKPLKQFKTFPLRWVWIFLVICLAFTIWRNLPGSPLALAPR